MCFDESTSFKIKIFWKKHLKPSKVKLTTSRVSVTEEELRSEQKEALQKKSSSRRMKSSSDFVQRQFKFHPKELSLKPLKAQVGGHVYMKILNDQYVCKPLNERELQFYQNIPQNLADHVPAFQGTLVGNEDSSGNRRFKI